MVNQFYVFIFYFIGNVFFGLFSDRNGRKKTLLICIFLQALFGITSAYVPWFWGFILARFLLAVTNGGTTSTSFVMCMEVVGGIWGAIVPILYQIPYGFGNSIMAAFAYFYRDWRDLQMVLAVISSVYVVYIWWEFTFNSYVTVIINCNIRLVPESPRWLLATGKREEAITILEKAAKCNKLDSDKVKIILNKSTCGSNKNQKQVSVFTLFATKELRKRSILLFINW